MNSALFFVFGFLILAIFLGIRSSKGKKMDLEQWSVGGRGFGAIFVFLLMAGEIYTTFSFLGASGWSYGVGAPALYFLGYIGLSYVASYWLLPAIWKYAKKNTLVSQSDFFASKYKSPFLGVFVAIVGVIALVPSMVVQLKGFGTIISQASYGAISMSAGVWIAAASLTIYVMISGIHGSAWTAVIKDLMMVVIIVFLGIYLPFHYYGGYQHMFEAINTAKPDFLKLPDKGYSVSWFISTVVLLILGFYMWPHVFSATYTAKSGKVFRKNAIISPLYTLMLLFAFFVGFAAIMKVPGLTGADGDLALLRISVKSFDPWIIGIIGGAGILTALVPGSMYLMSTSTLLAKNVYKVFFPSTTDQSVVKLAKLFVPVICLIGVYFSLHGGNTFSAFLLMGYSLITQLFPPLLFSLGRRNFVNKYGAFAGIIFGLAIVAYTTTTHSTIGSLFPSLPQAVQDLNIGFVSVIFNCLIMISVSLLTRKFTIQEEIGQIEEKSEPTINNTAGI